MNEDSAMARAFEDEARQRAWNEIRSGDRSIWDELNIEASCTIASVEADAGEYAKPWSEEEYTGGLGVMHRSGEQAAWLVALENHGFRCRWQLCDPGKAKTIKGLHRWGRQVLNGRARFSDSQAGADPAETFTIVRSMTPVLRDFSAYWMNVRESDSRAEAA